MALLKNRVLKIRSKNAGPFTVTVDIFCKNQADLEQIKRFLSTETLTRIYQVEEKKFEIFEVPSLSVLKISFPRIHSQGSRLDRDMHGAQFAELLKETEIPDNFIMD